MRRIGDFRDSRVQVQKQTGTRWRVRQPAATAHAPVSPKPPPRGGRVVAADYIAAAASWWSCVHASCAGRRALGSLSICHCISSHPPVWPASERVRGNDVARTTQSYRLSYRYESLSSAAEFARCCCSCCGIWHPVPWLRQ